MALRKQSKLEAGALPNYRSRRTGRYVRHWRRECCPDIAGVPWWGSKWAVNLILSHKYAPAVKGQTAHICPPAAGDGA